MKFLQNCILAACVMLLVAACRDSDDPETPPQVPPPVTNRPPVANAGADSSGLVGAPLGLSASSSSDPDGDVLSYSWVILSGPVGATLTNASGTAATFQATTAGSYVVQLTVKDPSNLSASDSLTITVDAPPPPPPPTGLRVRGLPSTLEQGQIATLAIELPAPAGAGGTQVNVLSNAPEVIEVPASVTVLEGDSVVAFNVEAAALGSARITVSATDMDAITADTVIGPDALDLSVSTGTNGIMLGQSTPTVTVTLHEPAPAGGASISLSLSNDRATLAATQLSIAAGATSATTTLTPAQPGSVVISARVAGVSSSDSLRVSLIPNLASATKYSDDLINEQLKAGALTAEQALVYRVYAAFGADELPAQYRGNDMGRLDSSTTREAAGKFTTLSASAQQAIAKYLFPPIYAGSWGEPQQATAPRTQSVRVRAADAASCFADLAGMPSTDTLPDWRFIQTSAFKIWYPRVVSGRNAQMGLYSADDAYAAAINIAATIQADFDRLRAVLGDPMRDGDQACNGGDARIDVYVTRVGLSAKAQVMSYLPGQCARPGWMWIAPDAIPDPRTARNIVAHELVHLFQLRVARSHCDDFRYSGFDEMHASWAFDHLYPRDNFEHQFALGNDGYFDGKYGEWNETPLLANAFWGITNCNGYCDYVFFEWLARKFGPTGLRAVMDAGATVNPARSFETGLAGVGGGLERLWPQFALAMWNDYEEHVQDDFHQWERLGGASLKMSFSKAENHFLTAELNGASKREMGQAIVNLVQGSLDPMTMDYLHIKFSDPQVSRIKLEHRAAVLHGAHSRVRVQALQKMDGQWQAAEDWSGENEKIFCRDKKAERIEELVLVYSNSYSGDAAFDRNPPSSIQLFDEDAKLPKLTLSNASCMPWHGTSKVTQTNSHGGVLRATAANVEFKLPSNVDPDEMEDLPLKLFVPASGLATVEGDWVDAMGCHQLTQHVQGAIGESDGQLYINLDTRVVTGYGLTTIPGSVHTASCPGTDPIAVPGPANSQWLSMPVLGTSLGDDGRTIDGSYDTFDPMTGVRTQSEWHFSSQREE